MSGIQQRAPGSAAPVGGAGLSDSHVDQMLSPMRSSDRDMKSASNDLKVSPI